MYEGQASGVLQSAKPHQPAAVEANDRVEHIIERVRDLADRIHAHANQVVGEAPPQPENAKIAEVDRGGLIGTIGSLERAVTTAEDAFRRLS